MHLLLIVQFISLKTKLYRRSCSKARAVAVHIKVLGGYYEKSLLLQTLSFSSSITAVRGRLYFRNTRFSDLKCRIPSLFLRYLYACAISRHYHRGTGIKIFRDRCICSVAELLYYPLSLSVVAVCFVLVRVGAVAVLYQDVFQHPAVVVGECLLFNQCVAWVIFPLCCLAAHIVIVAFKLSINKIKDHL